jgi:multisubunit Na+/H+ antiporter MnhE subunit
MIVLVAGSLLFARLTGHFSLGTAAIGFAVMAAVTGAWRHRAEAGGLLPALRRLTVFLWDFTVDLHKSNFVLAWDVLTPRDYHTVSMVEVDLSDLSRNECAILAHRITLTPGSLACGYCPETNTMVVHVMYPARGDNARLLKRPIYLLTGREEPK